MSLSETIQQSPAASGIGTISASIPFDYIMSTDTTMADTDSTSSAGSSDRSLERVTLNWHHTSNSNSDQDCSTEEMVQLQNMDNITEDEKLRDKEMCSDTNNNKALSVQKEHSIQLEAIVAEDYALVPRMRSFSYNDIPDKMDETENFPKIPPQIHVKLYRDESQLSKLKERKDLLKQLIASEKTDLSSSSSLPDLKNNKSRFLKPNLSTLRSKFHKSKSVPMLNVVLEEKENQLRSPSPSRCESPSRSPRIARIMGMFDKNKRPSPSHSAIIAQHRKKVSFLDMNNMDEDDTGLDNGSVNSTKKSSVITDNKKLENESVSASNDSRSFHSEHPNLSVDVHKNYNNNKNDLNDNESSADTTIKISKRPHLRGGRFCTLLRKFVTVLPRDEIAEKPHVIKDATDVLPLDNGEALVTDTLSNKMVLFDAKGYPKVTFAMENGSEPWSAVVLPDNGSMVATLKGDGCVCLWSPKGESQTDFGQGILSSPTGIHFDYQGRFVVTDEEKNAIFLFSRTGNYIGEFVNQDSLNPFAGNVTMETLHQPRYISGSKCGLYFVSDSSNQIVKIFDEAGNILRVIGSYGRDDGQFRFPYGVAFDEDTKLLYVADHYNNRVSVFSLNGTFLYHVLTQADGVTRPKGLAIRNSQLYVSFGSLRAGNVSVYHIHANREVLG